MDAWQHRKPELSPAEKQELVEAIDALMEEAHTTGMFREVERVERALGWTADVGSPDGTWVRPRLHEVLR